MEVPEFGIKNSRLANSVVRAIRDSSDAYEMAHRLVAIADDSIHSQTARDTVDLAIEYARTPGFSLSNRDLRRIKSLLRAALEDLNELKSEVGDDYFINGMVHSTKAWLNQIPKTLAEKVHQKLTEGEANDYGQSLSPYLMRLQMKANFGELKQIEQVVDENGLRSKLGRALEDLRGRIEGVAQIIRFPVHDGGGC